MKVEITHSAFDPWQALQQYQQDLDLQGKYGATASFVGTMRDLNEGDEVTAMTLEHYPGMTEQYIDKILEQANQEWKILDALVIHRTGSLLPNDPIVLVAVWSAHRADAFSACRFIMEELKSNAPFWKKEQLHEGSRWVKKNTPGG